MSNRGGAISAALLVRGSAPKVFPPLADEKIFGKLHEKLTNISQLFGKMCYTIVTQRKLRPGYTKTLLTAECKVKKRAAFSLII